MASTRTSHRAPGPASGPDGRRPVGAQGVLGVAAALTAAAAVLVVALAVGRAGTSSGTAGAVTGWGLPLARLALDVAALATIGLLLLGGFLLPAAGERLAGRGLSAVRTAAWWALAWAASAAVAGVLTLSDISGRPVGSVLNPLLLLDFVIEASQGRALLLVTALALVLAAFARRTRTVNDAWLLLVLAALTVVPPTLTGHAAESANHDLASLSLVLHVLAASAWVGGLGALVLYGTGAAPLREVAARYSQLALGCFALVGLSGVGNAAIRLSTGPDAVTQLWVSRYGWLVVPRPSRSSSSALSAGGIASGPCLSSRRVGRPRSPGSPAWSWWSWCSRWRWRWPCPAHRRRHRPAPRPRPRPAPWPAPWPAPLL